MARSWAQGEVLTAEEASPPLLPYDPAVIDVVLLDAETDIPSGAWKQHFGAARAATYSTAVERRDPSRGVR